MKISDLIKGKKHFSIGYFGGSITEGAGATSVEKCWRRLYTKHLAATYPDTQIEEINAAIGGTGSDLGLFRMKHDLLAHKPDMVFVEFAVNDYKLPDTDVYMENIIRNILSYNKNTAIVVLYTSTLEMYENDYKKGRLADSVAKQKKVCEYYNVISLDIGRLLLDKLDKREVTDKEIWIDGVHPTDFGYSIYEEYLEKTVENADVEIDALKKPMTDRLYPDADLVLTDSMANEDWHKSYCTMCNRLPGYIYCEKPGAELELEFSGSIVGLYYTIEKDSGDILYSVDGGKGERFSTWDRYALSFSRAHSCIINDKLDVGRHKIRIEISEDKAEKSEGRFVRIGAFLVG